MKNFFLFFAAIIPVALCAQITITSSDMPDVSSTNINDIDTYRISVINGPDTIDLTNTGAGVTWDYTFLQPMSQKLDTFVNTLATDPQYYLNFNNPFDQTHYASYAMAVAPPPNFSSYFQLTDVYYYFKENNSAFTQVGYGAKLNGISVSQQFDPVDIIYEFPLNFGNTSTSFSNFEFNLPNSNDYYGRRTERTNWVDGWGNLSTPFGTFQTLRIKSELKITDTLYLDTVQFGFTIPRPTQYEYKWLAKNMGVPVLQILSQKTGNNEIINEIDYRDSIRGGLISIENLASDDFSMKIFPNPNDGKFTLSVVNADFREEVVFVRNILGEIIFRSPFRTQTALFSFDFPNGIYFLQVGSKTGKFIVNR